MPEQVTGFCSVSDKDIYLLTYKPLKSTFSFFVIKCTAMKYSLKVLIWQWHKTIDYYIAWQTNVNGIEMPAVALYCFTHKTLLSILISILDITKIRYYQ